MRFAVARGSHYWNLRDSTVLARPRRGPEKKKKKKKIKKKKKKRKNKKKKKNQKKNRSKPMPPKQHQPYAIPNLPRDGGVGDYSCKLLVLAEGLFYGETGRMAELMGVQKPSCKSPS